MAVVLGEEVIGCLQEVDGRVELKLHFGVSETLIMHHFREKSGGTPFQASTPGSVEFGTPACASRHQQLNNIEYMKTNRRWIEDTLC